MTAEVERVSIRGTWWRQVAAGLDPLELREPPADGRWQRGDRVGASYLAESEATVWAEWYRALAELAVPPRVWLPCDLWRIAVDVEEIADLSDGERLAAVGLPMPAPGRASWSAYQGMGERLRGEGFAGVIAPSAARVEGQVLCVFGAGPKPFSEAARDVMRAAIAALPSRQRAVLTLRDIEGYSAAEARSALGVSEPNQRVLLHRARSKVRAALERHLEAGRGWTPARLRPVGRPRRVSEPPTPPTGLRT